MPTAVLLTISVNGEIRRVDADAVLPDVLADHGVDAAHTRGIAVAINDAIVRRQEWPSRRIEEGDRVEIVTARQGG